MGVQQLHMAAAPEAELDRQRPWSVEFTAEFLGLSRAHIYNQIAKGEFPAAARIGGRVVILPQKLLEWLEAGGDTAGAPRNLASLTARTVDRRNARRQRRAGRVQ